MPWAPVVIKADDGDAVLRMVREVNSPHLKICLDAPLMPDKSARELAAIVGTSTNR